MRNIKFSIFFALIMIIVSCGKEENNKIPDFERVPLPKFALANGATTDIDVNSLSSFKTKFDIGVYYTDDTPPSNTNIVIAKDGDYKNVKTLQADIKNLPASVEFTGDQLVQLFGPISGGSFFEIGAEMTSASGFVTKPFNSNALIYTGDNKNFPGSKPILKYSTICAFNVDNFVGDFEVITDDWVDYAPGTVIKVSKVNSNAVSFTYNCGSFAIPIVLNVNPTTFRISGDKNEYCSYDFPPITKVFGDVVEGDKSFADGCTTTLNVTLKHTLDDGTDFGNYSIVLKKK